MSQSNQSAEATSFAEAMENLDLKTPQQGELLRGTIVSISGEDAYISYGGPSEAVMDTAELEGLDIGDQIEATVVKTGSEIRQRRKLTKGKASPSRRRQAHRPQQGRLRGEHQRSPRLLPAVADRARQDREPRRLREPEHRVPRHRALR